MNGKLSDIQILRAIAILLVIFGHLSFSASLLDTMPTKVNGPFWIGVQLFFIISGYVVTRSVCRGTLNPIPFLIRRVFRLFPVLFFFLALSLLAFYLANATAPNSFGYQRMGGSLVQFTKESLAILGGYYINLKREEKGLYMFGAIWSLSAEFQFYLAFAAVIALPALFSLRKKYAMQIMTLAALIPLIITLHYRLALVTSLTYHGWWGYYLARSRFDFLLMGMLLYLVPTLWRGEENTKPMVAGNFFSAIMLCIPLMLVMMSEGNAEGHFLNGITLPLVSVCFTILVAIAARQSAFPKGGRIYRALLWVGDRSYAIFLLHYPVMALFWIAAYKNTMFIFFLPPMGYAAIQAGVVIPVTLLLAHLTYRYIEQPLNDKGHAIAARWKD